MGTDPLPLDEAAARALSGVTTATLTTVLLKKGLRNVWMRGSKSLRSGQGRVVGRAFTLRFVPVREDLATPESWSAPISTRAAIEAASDTPARAAPSTRLANSTSAPAITSANCSAPSASM